MHNCWGMVLSTFSHIVNRWVTDFPIADPLIIFSHIQMVIYTVGTAVNINLAEMFLCWEIIVILKNKYTVFSKNT